MMNSTFKDTKNIKRDKPDSCCSSDNEHVHSSDDGHDHDQDHSHGDGSYFQMFIPAVISFCLLLIAIGIDNCFPQTWFTGWIRIGWYIIAYIPVGYPVLKEAFKSIRKGNLFSEFSLMTIATVGAFAIEQFPEGVAVMLFYGIGEIVQSLAVRRAKSNIKLLLDQRPDYVTVLDGNKTVLKKASEIAIGAIIQLKPGEKLALDGKLLSESATFNTAALTGEKQYSFGRND
jgi:Cd2+/Zn2+-exporting ATPase